MASLFWPLVALVLPIVQAITAPECQQNFQKHCLAFEADKFIPNSIRNRVEFVPNGTTINLPENDRSCGRPSQKVAADLCRVALYIRTSHRSGITFELWLPEKWQGSRFIATGNGGVDGCVKYEDLAYAASRGFAVVGTNNGHNSTSGAAFYKNPDIIEDFAYRALHTGTTAGKLLVEKFYQKRPDYSYYIGWSLGGRMGIKAAEAFPHDYDGIIAGCPAVDFNNLYSQRAMFYPITGAMGSKDFITKDVWINLIHKEVLRQCDKLDGVEDGIIEDPGKCHFNPETLLCKTKDQDSSCLNQAQVEKLKKIYAPYTYPNGTLIYPRMNPGNEILAATRILAGEPFGSSQDWFRYVVLNDPKWDAAGFNTTFAALAERLNPSNIRTFPNTLPEFKKKGGKILSYHGGQDQQISAFNTERFWDHMAAKDANLQDYFRFFRVSGMFHGLQGPGAWVLGQTGGPATQGIPFDPQRNILAALVAWVEDGRAPNTLTGTKFVNDTVSLGIDFQRDHCLYPKTQTYIGGNYKQRSSWACK